MTTKTRSIKYDDGGLLYTAGCSREGAILLPLQATRNLSIEFHGPECIAALELYGYRKQVLSELTFCMDLRPKHA